MLLKLTAVVVLFALAGLPAQAADTIPKGNYALDPDHAQVVFAIKHMGLSTFYGRFGKITGALSIDPAAPEQSTLDILIDMNVIDTHVPKLDGELKEDVFESAKFPTAMFKATKIVQTGNNTGTVSGDLTIKGITKPVTLNVTFNGGRNSQIPFSPYRLGFDATATVKRADFGLTGYMWSGFVGDDVTLAIEAEFEKQ